MQSVVAEMGWPEIIGLLIIVVTILGAKQVPGLLNGINHGLREFMKANREVQDDVAAPWGNIDAHKGGKASHLREFIFWFITAIVVVIYALALVHLWLRS
jgi:Sec-independent protein translocase protein TatA